MRFNKKGNLVASPSCPFQGSGVICNPDTEPPGHCDVCGWNSKVAAKRKAAIRQRLGFGKEEEHEQDSDAVR